MNLSAISGDLAFRPDPLPPELLDHVPPDSPEARAGRRDLRRINALMGNHRWLASQLAVDPPRGVVLELGAGDAAHLDCYTHLEGLHLHAIDLAPRPETWPSSWPWTRGDLLVEAWPPADTVIASLLLHHFGSAGLRAIGQRLTHARRILFVEPIRHRRHLWQGALLGPLLHPLTRHDLALSVRAGFRPGELASALGLEPAHWQVRETPHSFGGLRFEARRR